MAVYTEMAKELQDRLRLRTKVIGYRRLDKITDLEKIGRTYKRFPNWFTGCQISFYARYLGLTVAVTKDAKMGGRCKRLFGLREVTEESMSRESTSLASTWFASFEDAMRQQHDYPRIPVGEAIVVGPLETASFEPEVVLIYGNPAQVMMVLCGLQKEKYERFQFSFIGEGACADSLAQCYVSGKPAVSIPCYGERAMGQVSDEEMIVALPANEMERSVSGLRKLAEAATGFSYPMPPIGGLADVEPVERIAYPEFADDFLK